MIFLDEGSISYLIQKYQEGHFGREWMEKYLYWVFVYKKELGQYFIDNLNKVTENLFFQPVVKSYRSNEINKENLKREKQIYFNQECYISAIVEIFDILGKEQFEKSEIYNLFSDKAEQETELYSNYPNPLLWMIDDHYYLSKDELIERIIRNWDWFSINQIKDFLGGSQKEINADPDLCLNSEEINIIKAWCDNHLHHMQLQKEVTNSDIAFAWFVMYCKFTHYSEDTYLQMVSSSIQRHLEFNIIEFIQEYRIVPFPKLKNHVLGILKTNDVEGWEAQSYLTFIENQQIQEARSILPFYIEHKSERLDVRGFALGIFIKLGGDDEYLKDLFKRIIPASDDYREETLLNHFSHKPDNGFAEILLDKLSSSNKKEDQVRYATYLLGVGKIEGLKYLIDYIEKERKSPFFIHDASPNFRLENPKGIPLLLKLFHYSQDKSIQQDAFNRISSAGRKMLLYLASCQNRRYFHQVHQSVRWHMRWHISLNKMPWWFKKQVYVVHPDALKELRYLIKDLEFQHYQKEDVPLEEAVEKYKKLI